MFVYEDVSSKRPNTKLPPKTVTEKNPALDWCRFYCHRRQFMLTSANHATHLMMLVHIINIFFNSRYIYLYNIEVIIVAQSLQNLFNGCLGNLETLSCHTAACVNEQNEVFGRRRCLDVPEDNLNAQLYIPG